MAGKKIYSRDFSIFVQSDRRYRQEVYLHKDKIYVFGGGGVSGISFSLENVSAEEFDLSSNEKF